MEEDEDTSGYSQCQKEHSKVRRSAATLEQRWVKSVAREEGSIRREGFELIFIQPRIWKHMHTVSKWSSTRTEKHCIESVRSRRRITDDKTVCELRVWWWISQTFTLRKLVWRQSRKKNFQICKIQGLWGGRCSLFDYSLTRSDEIRKVLKFKALLCESWGGLQMHTN